MKNIFYGVFLLLIVSCGYRTPEEDKHPDLPIFPEHTNASIQITPFSWEANGLQFNDNYIFASTHKSLLVLDRKFNKVKEIDEIVSTHSIDNEGQVYIITRTDDVMSDPKEVYKISPDNNFVKEKMEVLIMRPREGVRIRDSITAAFKNKQSTNEAVSDSLIDSLVYVAFNKEREELPLRIKKLEDDIVAVFPLDNDVSILKYKDKKVALFSTYNHMDFLKDKRSGGLKPIRELEKRPTSFDKVVLGNSFSGNHYVGGYTPYGFNYIELTLENEVTRFKAHNSNNGDGVHILYKSKDTMILKDTREKLYYVTLKK